MPTQEELYMEIYGAMDGNVRMSRRRDLLAAFEAEIRKDCAVIVRAQAPKYLENDVDVHTFHVLDAAAAAVTNPVKDN